MHILLAAGSFILLPISVSGDRSRAGQFTHQPQILQCPMEQTDKWQVVCGRGACSSMSFLVVKELDLDQPYTGLLMISTV